MTRIVPFLVAAAFLIPGPAWAAKDRDGDGVRDRDDACEGQDDRVDLDANSQPDCGENLLVGAGFDSVDQGLAWEDDVSGNSSTGVSFEDGQGYLYSGSLDIRLSGPFDTATQGSRFSSCVEVEPGSRQLLMAQVQVQSEGSGELALLEYGDLVDCLGRTGALARTRLGGRLGTVGWEDLGGPLSLSGSTRYARVEVRAEKSGQQGVLTRWDNVLLKPLADEPALASAE